MYEVATSFKKMTLTAWAPYWKWFSLKARESNRSNFKAGVPRGPLALQFRQVIREAVKDSDVFFMQRFFHPLSVDMNKIHMFTVSITSADTREANPTPYGMAQVRTVLSGTELVLGVRG